MLRADPIRWHRFLSWPWLLFLVFPLQQFYAQPRLWTEQLTFGVLLLGFVCLYLVVFRTLFTTRPLEPFPKWNLVGIGWCVLSFFLILPWCGWTAATGFLSYAVAMGAFQRSVRFNVSTVLLIVLLLLWLMVSQDVPAAALAGNLFICISVGVGNHFGYRAMSSALVQKQTQPAKEHLAQVAERERIARDLHDLLGHTLSVIVLKSDLASKLMERNAERAKQELQEVEKISREALTEVRLAVQGYKGTDLKSELGRIKIALDAAGIQLEHLEEAVELSPEQQGTLQLVLREAITNIIRHAKAKTCWVSLQNVHAGVLLIIQDDGVGIQNPQGNGMKGMRERTEALGGKFSVKSHPGQGTTIEILIRS
ncbi:sensor histidine kinase [Deinococcus cellulosilyticus]|uniref:Two-component sensor histidine kinase n=1 Tax=Deinococcus cellulosilyticus (strain DSM 18568 / NBRC 106333 / KACC 11606 / 5516J-15) TaxID=1223518 RepID=A0A511N270_DEIC1|nr:sensor histidine kinase [Deinococcus cellulosilyticus]GEM46496.1 two-component sensor histidine kinase [Deinococcus cellulosilyticus NBRC 106333 = KACC 11606]